LLVKVFSNKSMSNTFEYLCIPLDGETQLKLPYTVYDSTEYKVVLKQFNEQDLERAFRLKFESGEQPGSYNPVYIDQRYYFEDNNITHALHGMQLQLCVIPKKGHVDENIRERLSIALECALGFLDEYVSWVNKGFSTVASRGVYRSHSSVRNIGTIGEVELRTINTILAYKESSGPSFRTYDVLRALLKAASHQSGASDVACVLYFSVLEAIFVDGSKELVYKLSMRLARYKGGDHGYFDTIKKLYDKRSNVIHGSKEKNKFNQAECLLIESLAKDAFVDMLANPNMFTEAELDKQLLV
jgi:hypothetical protein